MQRIGLFGGSFNPIHNGHLHLVQTAKEGLGLSHVYLIPARVSPFKQIHMGQRRLLLFRQKTALPCAVLPQRKCRTAAWMPANWNRHV